MLFIEAHRGNILFAIRSYGWQEPHRGEMLYSIISTTVDDIASAYANIFYYPNQLVNMQKAYQSC